MSEAKGVNGTVSFDGQFVTIARSGLMARATVGKGDKRIPVSSITAVQWKPAGLMNGYIEFTISGGSEHKARFGSTSIDQTKNENAVVFGKKHEAAMDALRTEIDGPGTTGIVVVGIDEDKHLWVLDDYSIEDASPNQWALRLAQASADYNNALVVAEKNNGHRMVAEVIKNSVPNLPLDTVWASESKKARAEPLSVMWEAEFQTAHFAGPEPDTFVKLWDQLTSWVPGPTGAGQFSPDHLDAMVWAGAKLLEGSGTAEAHFPGSSVSQPRAAGIMAARMGGY